MVKEEGKLIETIRCAFKNYIKRHNEVEALLIYGSYVRGDMTPRSDIDLCLVVPEVKTNTKKGIMLIRSAWREVDLDFSRYDLRIFELLPLYIQISIIKNHKVIYARSIPNLYEYFYFNYLKLWKDQEKRAMTTTYF